MYTKEDIYHKQAVEDIIKILRKHTPLGLKPDKCKFLRCEVQYLCLIIFHNQIEMDPIKVRAVFN